MFPISLYLIEQVGISPDWAISLILFGLMFLSFGGVGHLAFDTAINASNFLSLWAINGNSLITMVSLSLVSCPMQLRRAIICNQDHFLRVISPRPSDSSASSAVFGLAAPMRLVWTVSLVLKMFLLPIQIRPEMGRIVIMHAISNLQRNGENRGAFGRENRDDFGGVSSRLQIGEQHSSSSPTDAFDSSLQIGEQHSFSSLLEIFAVLIGKRTVVYNGVSAF